jgi:hypothetical protein
LVAADPDGNAKVDLVVANAGTSDVSVAQTEGQEGSTPPAATRAAPAAQPDQAGALPFTGLDLVLLVTVGGVLVLSGFGIRRLLHPTATA